MYKTKFLERNKWRQIQVSNLFSFSPELWEVESDDTLANVPCQLSDHATQFQLFHSLWLSAHPTLSCAGLRQPPFP